MPTVTTLVLALACAVVGVVVGSGVALWTGRQQRRSHGRILDREHQRALIAEVLVVLQLFEEDDAADPELEAQHRLLRRRQTARSRQIEGRLTLAPFSVELVRAALAALEAADLYASYGPRALVDGAYLHALVADRSEKREEFLTAARRELGVGGPRSGALPTTARTAVGHAPRRART